MNDENPRSWSRFVSALPTMLPWLREAVALERCASTQDECRIRSAGTPGLMVTAMEQSGGRGQHGRAWVQAPRAGLAMTVSLDAGRYGLPVLSLAGGLAAARAVRTWVVGPAAASVGVKWPNDVMAVGPSAGAKLKISGTLVEVRDGLAYLGIGINVRQQAADFPPELRGRAGSIRMLSAGNEALSRLDVLGTLMVELGTLLHSSPEELGLQWHERDVLAGTVQAFEHDGRRITGRVLRIDPSREIVVETDLGLERLPAMLTRLVKDDEPAPAARSE